MTDFITRILCKLGFALDIRIGTEFPVIVLCNTYPKPFVLDGVRCGSVEGFLQAIKLPDHEQQVRVCSLSGLEAKNESTSLWKKTQMVYWDGKEYNRQDLEFQKLLRRVYRACYDQNELFRSALAATGHKRLVHLVGKCDPRETILTRDEMCDILTELRSFRISEQNAK